MENYPKKEDKYWVLERKIVFLILFFKYYVVLTWKIVVPPKASVLYIYIDNPNSMKKKKYLLTKRNSIWTKIPLTHNTVINKSKTMDVYI